MAREEIKDITELRSIKAQQSALPLQDALISTYDKFQENIESIEKCLPSEMDDRKQWKEDKVKCSAESIVDLANVSLYKEGSTLYLKKKDKVLAERLSKYITDEAKKLKNVSNISGEEEVEAAKKTLVLCLNTLLYSVLLRYSRSLARVKRARSYRRLLGTFFSSLCGLGLMGASGKYRANIALDSNLVLAIRGALCVSTAASSAVLLYKHRGELKGTFDGIRSKARGLLGRS